MRRGAMALACAVLALSACTEQEPAAQPRSTTTEAPRQAPATPGGPVKVGLFVPLNAADENRVRVAQSLVNAARLAQADLTGAAIDLKIYATAGDPTRAREAATRAVADGVQIIVGPLFGTVAQAVGPVADQAGINVLTFSTTPSVAGKNVFLLGQTAATEADRLLSYASSQGIGSLGLFYPRTPSGQVAAQALRQAAARHGLTVLTAIDYPRSFQGIQDRSQVYAAEHSAEAVAIPEGGQGLVSAGAFLNYYNVSPRATRYLGLGQWNGPATSTEAALQGGWFVAPDPALFDAFSQRYLATYGTNPAPIAGLAYDGIAAVGALIRDARAAQDSRPFAVENLVNPSGFAGVNGIFRLRRDGMIDRALAVMEVTEDGFTVRDPAPRRFDRPSG
ncbi:MAG: penicillin-binding protein activator [Pseudomonadota bacterium]